MRLALLGDIHGNHIALEAVLDAARRLRVDRLLVTGDIVGYYFWPAEVMEMLLPWDKIVVRGNHEDMLARARGSTEFLAQIDRRYGRGLRLAIECLSSEQLDWLESLPHPLEVETDAGRILLCHGTPWDLNAYLYPDTETGLLRRCADTGHDLVVLGHTHYPMERKSENCRIVNPGSVGQPRDRRPGAQWAMLDTDSNEIAFFLEEYDPTPVLDAARELQPDIPYLQEVLLRT